MPPGFAGGLVMVAGALLPTIVITVLCAYATVVALSANKQRSKRAALVLRQLLDTLRALCRFGRGRH
ncbi:MAG TPA: hypothetical protein VF477_03230 [Mycobacterium sp.]